MQGTQLIVRLKVTIRYLLAELVKERISYLLQCFFISHFVALADILRDDGSIERIYIFILQSHIDGLREPSLHEVSVKGMKKQTILFRCERIQAKPLSLTILCKRKRVQPYFAISAR